MPPACRRSSAGRSSLRLRPPPAAGFTIARKFCPKFRSPLFLWKTSRSNQPVSRLQAHHCRPPYRFADFFREPLSLDLHRGCSGEIFFPDQISADTFEIGQAAISSRDLFQQLAVEPLILVQAQNENQCFVP